LHLLINEYINIYTLTWNKILNINISYFSATHRTFVLRNKSQTGGIYKISNSTKNTRAKHFAILHSLLSLCIYISRNNH